MDSNNEERTTKFEGVVSQDLTKIDFSDRYWEATDAEVTGVLKETVVFIDLEWCSQITNKTVYAIAENCPNLESINLFKCDSLTDDALVTLAVKCPLLKLINVRLCTELTDKTALAIAQNCPNLESIDLSGCQNLTDNALVALAENCRLLKSIDVWGCVRLTDKTAYALAQNCQNLESIVLGDCSKITGKGVQHLCEYGDNRAMPLLPNVRRLDLRFCRLASLPENIGNLASLRDLNIKSNQLTKLPHSVTKLSPDCDINVDYNPLKEPPLEIARHGLSAIKRYFEELDRGATISRQLKVVLVGDGKAGKTSLRHAISGRIPSLTGDTTDEEFSTIYLEREHIQLDQLMIMVYD